MKLKQLMIVLFFVLFGLFLPQTVQAGSPALSVQPEQAASQRDASVSYFDLLVKPNQAENLKVKLTNNSQRKIVVDVKAATATTSNAGSVDYTGASNHSDTSLSYQLSKLVKGPKKISVPANGSVVYTSQLKMPAANLDGILAGALVFQPQISSSSQTSGQMKIVNKYNYTIALLVRNSTSVPQPKLKIGTIKAKRATNQNQIAIHFRNVAAQYANRVRVETKVTHPNGKVTTKNQSKIQMAPNSQFDYAVKLSDKVPSGKYRVKTTAYYDKNADGKYTDSKGDHYDHQVTKSQTVQITNRQADKLNQAARQSKGGLPMIYIIAIIIGVILVLLLGLTWYYLVRKRKQQAAQVAKLKDKLDRLEHKD